MTKEGRVEELQALISLGKKKGYLTYEEINNRLPEDITSPEQIDRILIKLDEMEIEVIDSPREAGRPQAKKVAGPPSGGAEPEVDLSPAPVGRTDDPVRMYLREMGKTPLLSREGEIGIAKRIEEGRREVTEAVCRAGIAVREVIFLGERLLQGRLRVSDLIALNDFDEISEQKEKELIAELMPVLKGLRQEQEKVEELARRLERAEQHGNTKRAERLEHEMQERKGPQAGYPGAGREGGTGGQGAQTLHALERRQFQGAPRYRHGQRGLHADPDAADQVPAGEAGGTGAADSGHCQEDPAGRARRRRHLRRAARPTSVQQPG